MCFFLFTHLTDCTQQELARPEHPIPAEDRIGEHVTAGCVQILQHVSSPARAILQQQVYHPVRWVDTGTRAASSNLHKKYVKELQLIIDEFLPVCM